VPLFYSKTLGELYSKTLGKLSAIILLEMSDLKILSSSNFLQSMSKSIFVLISNRARNKKL